MAAYPKRGPAWPDFPRTVTSWDRNTKCAVPAEAAKQAERIEAALVSTSQTPVVRVLPRGLTKGS